MAGKLALHIAHYKKNDVARICTHDQRLQAVSPEHINASISDLNYQASTGKPLGAVNYNKEILKLLTESGIRRERNGHSLRYVYADNRPMRKDANLITSVVVTLDRATASAWGEQKTRAYFKECSDYLKAFVGNRIDDAVHADEAGAGYHMHFVGVSLLADKQGVTKLNVKNVWTRSKLRQLHTDLAKHLQEKGFEIERGQEYSDIAYTESYKQFKRDTMAVQLQAGYIDKVIDTAQAQAQHQEESPGFLGIGKHEATATVPEATFNMMNVCLKQEQKAVIEYHENRKRIDRSQQLRKAQKKIAQHEAEIEAMTAKHRQEVERLQQDQEQLAKSIPAKIEKARQEAVAEYERRNAAIIRAGKAVEPILEYPDLVKMVNEVRKEALKRKQHKRDNRRAINKSNTNDLEI